MKILESVTSRVVTILGTSSQQDLLNSDTRFCASSQVFHTNIKQILVNWWVVGVYNEEAWNNVVLPPELVRTDWHSECLQHL